MKKTLCSLAIAGTIVSLLAVGANAATSKNGHYYYGAGSVIPVSEYASIHARADNKSLNSISRVTAVAKTGTTILKQDSGVYWAEVQVNGSPMRVNEAKTGAYDSAGYKETVHAKR
ncbi:MAG: hypothetical protein ACRC7N_14700 [Clostridium sp.]